MQADCKVCDEGTCDYEDLRMEIAVCSECGARFETEADADFIDGEYKDASTLGKRIK